MYVACTQNGHIDFGNMLDTSHQCNKFGNDAAKPTTNAQVCT